MTGLLATLGSRSAALLDEREALLRRAGGLADAFARQRVSWPGRPPLVLIGAGTTDVLLDPGSEVTAGQFMELARVIERAGLDPDILRGAEPAALDGIYWTLRGVSGELYVADELTAGSLPLPAGTARVELVPHHHPGADLVFGGADGQQLAAANVKIAATPDVVLRHFDRHPDVRLVYAPSDTAATLEAAGWTVRRSGEVLPADGFVVVDIGQPTGWFDERVHAALDGSLGDLAGPAGAIDGFVPWLGLSVLVFRAVRAAGRGQAFGEVATQAARDGVTLGAAIIAAKVTVTATGLYWAAALAAFGAGSVTHGVLNARREWRLGAKQEQALTAELKRLQRQLHRQQCRRCRALRRASSFTRPGRHRGLRLTVGLEDRQVTHPRAGSGKRSGRSTPRVHTTGAAMNPAPPGSK